MTLGDSTTTTTAALGVDDQKKKDIILIINNSNSHPSQCYPRIRLRNASQCNDMMISPTITDGDTNIIEAHYDRIATVAPCPHGGVYPTVLPHIDLLSHIDAHQIKHLYLEAGPIF